MMRSFNLSFVSILIVALFGRLNCFEDDYDDSPAIFDNSDGGFYDHMCQDWENFRDEKCYKLIKGDTYSFDAAIAACRNLDQGNKNGTNGTSISRLVVIESEDEQKFVAGFVFNDSQVVDNVWIGLRRNRNGQFSEWIDRTPVTYTNWDQGRPTNRPNKDCVDMMADDGIWSNDDCRKKNAVICQRYPVVSPEAVPEMVIRMQKRMKEQDKKMKELEEDMDEIKNNPKPGVPVGFIYVQLSNQAEPERLFPNTNWTDVSDEYAGLFFRASGNGSAPFGQVQEDASPRVAEVMSRWFYGDVETTTTTMNPASSTAVPKTTPVGPTTTEPPGPPVPEQDVPLLSEARGGIGWWSRNIFTGRYGGSAAANPNYDKFSRVIKFKTSTAEVRPRNSAVRIWRRVA